ncbi:hypothetical protein FKW77_003296 [Venturia effusa]|uniref:Uncharacterized protein n=1 Tax=Venturia effusa TaxID=50376 RepID=A0A517LGU4_9PEZI|nr:hypothetical protein FKW77_003296 [Venturia effusa]
MGEATSTKSITKPLNLDTVPTEIMEAIASEVANEDVLHLRLINATITAKTFRPFADRFLTTQSWSLARLLAAKHYNLRHDEQAGTIGGLVFVPDFMSHVKHLELKFANHFQVSFRTQALARDISLFDNLQSFTFEGVEKKSASGDFFAKTIPNFWSQDGHAELFNQLRLPHLQNLTIKNTNPLHAESICNMILNHQPTLSSFKLIRVCLIDDKEVRRGERAKWLTLLRALKGMQSDARVEISVPRVLRTYTDSFFNQNRGFLGGQNWIGLQAEVSFKSWKDGQNTNSVHIMDGMLHGWDGAHYSSVQGQLQQFLDCLIQNYRELFMAEEVRDAGAIFDGDMITRP